MIEAEVLRNDLPIMHRSYYDQSMTLEKVIKRLEDYIVDERLNKDGECLIRARYR